MKIIQTGTTTLCAVQVPESSINFQESMGYLMYKKPNYKNWVNEDVLSNPAWLSTWLSKRKDGDDYTPAAEKLPPGEWTLLCHADQITEEQAKKIVLWHDETDESQGFERYMTDVEFQRTDLVEALNTATDSFGYLLRVNDLNPHTTVILVKRS